MKDDAIRIEMREARYAGTPMIHVYVGEECFVTEFISVQQRDRLREVLGGDKAVLCPLVGMPEAKK